MFGEHQSGGRATPDVMDGEFHAPIAQQGRRIERCRGHGVS
jgi:hypothetical protein